jgi:hypothetical protein
LKEATMIAIGIVFAAITVIGVGRTIHAVATDGHGRVPTRTYPSLFDLR